MNNVYNALCRKRDFATLKKRQLWNFFTYLEIKIIQGVFYPRPSLTRRNSQKKYRISKSKGTFDIYIKCAIW